MDWETIGQAFERQPTKLIAIDSASGKMQAYQASPDGKPPKPIDLDQPSPEQGKDPPAA
jgi:hypothetical protein